MYHSTSPPLSLSSSLQPIGAPLFPCWIDPPPVAFIIMSNPTFKNSPTPPCPHPLPYHCLSALMLIIATEWICRFPWMSAEPLAWFVAPLLLVLSSFRSFAFSSIMRIRKVTEVEDGEGETEGWFAMLLRHSVTLRIKAVTTNKPEMLLCLLTGLEFT